MATDTTHALYTVLDADEGGEGGRIRILVWNNIMARQRFQPGQVRPHWKIYKREIPQEARDLLVSQVDAYTHSGHRMTVKPVLVPVTDDLAAEFEKEGATVSYAFRGVLAKVDERRAIPFADAEGV